MSDNIKREFIEYQSRYDVNGWRYMVALWYNHETDSYYTVDVTD